MSSFAFFAVFVGFAVLGQAVPLYVEGQLGLALSALFSFLIWGWAIYAGVIGDGAFVIFKSIQGTFIVVAGDSGVLASNIWKRIREEIIRCWRRIT